MPFTSGFDGVRLDLCCLRLQALLRRIQLALHPAIGVDELIHRGHHSGLVIVVISQLGADDLDTFGVLIHFRSDPPGQILKFGQRIVSKMRFGRRRRRDRSAAAQQPNQAHGPGTAACG